jgi:HD-like signal output (HDOD) protein
MSVVHVNRIEEDMVLSKEVKDIKGRLLLKEGQKIQSNHIKVLKTWGITEVDIVGDACGEEGPSSHLDAESVEKAREDTTLLFRNVDLGHPAIHELFQLAVEHRIQDPDSEAKGKITHDNCDDTETHLSPDVLKKIMQSEVKLPEIPSIVFELNDILSDPLASVDSIGQIVSKSPSLTAVLLKIVNSSSYGLVSRIDSIPRAVTVIGTQEIGNLALGISVITVFEGIPGDILDMSSFLRHGFACGIMSRIFAAQKDMQKTEQLFVSGLLHDIGRLVVYKYFQEHTKTLFARAGGSGKPLYEEEISCLGCSHAEIGRYLLKEWKLPSTLVDNVLCHHDPSSAQDPQQATIVHLADIIANGLGLGSSGESLVPEFDYEAWENLDLSPSCFSVVISQAIDQLSAFEMAFQNQ